MKRRPQTAAPRRGSDIVLDVGGRVRRQQPPSGVPAAAAAQEAFLTAVANIERSPLGASRAPILQHSPVPREALDIFDVTASSVAMGGGCNDISTTHDSSVIAHPLGIEDLSHDAEVFFEHFSQQAAPLRLLPPRPSSALCERTQRLNHIASTTWDAYLDVSTREVRERIAMEETARQRAIDAERERERAKSVQAASLKAATAHHYLMKRRATNPLEAALPRAAAATDTFDVEAAREQSRLTWQRLQQRALEGNSLSLQATKRAFGMTPMEKLEHLRTNPDARRELAQRLAAEEEERQKKALAERGDIRSRNVRAIGRHQKYFQQAMHATSALRLKQRLENAKRKRDGLQSWKMARAIDDLQRPEFLRLQRTHATEVEILQNTWITMIFAAAALCEMHDKMLEALKAAGQVQRLRRFLRHDAALQQNLHQRQTVRLVRASAVIWSYWLRCRDRIRLNKRTQAITIVSRFLRDLGESVRIPIAVKKKLKYVRLLQRKYRMARTMRKLRVTLGCMQLERALQVMYRDDDLEVKQLQTAHKTFQKDIANKRGIHRLAKNEMITEHARQTDAQVLYLMRRQRAVVSLTKEMQASLVSEAMERKTIDFSNQTYRYGVALKFFTREVEELKRAGLALDATGTALVYINGGGRVLTGDDAAGRKVPTRPIRPYLRTLFTKEEIARIVAKGMDALHAEEVAAGTAAALGATGAAAATAVKK